MQSEKNLIKIKLQENMIYFEEMLQWVKKNKEKTILLQELREITDKYDRNVSDMVDLLKRTELDCHAILIQAYEDCLHICKKTMEKLEKEG